MAKRKITADDILDTALGLAHGSSWERLTLAAIADALAVNLDDIRVHFAQKDDLVEAWFDRADSAMLRSSAGFAASEPADRVHRVIMSWLDALAPHRELTRQMLYYKLEPGHFHLQALGILRISRTVQWFREAARLEATHGQRIVEEAALTATYLVAFARWLHDGSENFQATRHLLERLLHGGAPLMSLSAVWLQPRTPRQDAGNPPA